MESCNPGHGSNTLDYHFAHLMGLSLFPYVFIYLFNL